MNDDRFIREPTPDELAPPPQAGLVVVVDGDGEAAPSIGPEGEVHIETPDGGLNIYPNGLPQEPKDTSFDANLADSIDEGERTRISEELLTGIESDLTSRDKWMQSRQKGMGLLALQVESPKGTSADGGGEMQGVSVVRSPLLLEATLRFQANASAELLPSTGPAKIRNDTPPKTRVQQKQEDALAAQGITAQQEETDTLGECLEREFNHYLTAVDKEYYPDFRRMLFYTGFGGSGFRKVYRCPLKRRPVSRAIDAEDLIVADPEVSLHDAGRVTHKIMMRQSVLKRMQLAKQYRDIPLAPPVEGEDDAVTEKERDIAGFAPVHTLPSDYKHTIYECYCELDIKGFGDKSVPGLPLPYRVTIDKDSREILDIRRNWREGDDRFQARMPIVKYPFVEGISFYGIGLLHILGNSTAAVTAAWRLALDAGMMASFPAFLYSDQVSRQNTNVFRLAPGAGSKVNTGGLPISDMVMPVPYKDASPGLINMMTHVEETAGRVGGVAELPVGEGKQDAPVGTTIALLDQATKVMAAVHKGLHSAQAEEFALLIDLFREEPDALIAGNKNPTRNWQADELLQALNNVNLVPAADPNTPSHMVRVMRAVALIQLYQMNPAAFDFREMAMRVSKMVGEDDITPLLAPPQQQPPDLMSQAAMVMAQAKLMDSHTRQQDSNVKAATSAETLKLKAADIASRQQTAQANVTRDLIIHSSEAQQAHQDRMMQQHNANADRNLQAGVEAGHLAHQQRQHADQTLSGHVDRLLRIIEANANQQRPPTNRVI